MLTRKNPDIGYMKDSVFNAFAFVQTVRAGNTIYFSGVAPLRGGIEDLEIVGAGDFRSQMEFCYEILGRCLAEEGLGFEHVVATTMYTTDMQALAQCGDLLVKAFGDNGPTATAVEVKGLFHPQQMFEVTAIAVAP